MRRGAGSSEIEVGEGVVGLLRVGCGGVGAEVGGGEVLWVSVRGQVYIGAGGSGVGLSVEGSAIVFDCEGDLARAALS